MIGPKNIYVRNCLYKANEDIAVIKKLTDEEDGISFYTSMICFHCQQAVEKFFKAFLAFNEKEISKTHDLFFLLEECQMISSKFDPLELKELTDFGVEVRYPDDFYVPDVLETKFYVTVAYQVKELVESLIQIEN